MPPREPRKIVGRSARRRGPSEAISTSALKQLLVRAHSSRRPGEPVSSPISIRNLALKPSVPRSASTAASACMLIDVLALVVGDAAAVPAAVALGQLPRRQAFLPLASSPRITSPWP